MLISLLRNIKKLSGPKFAILLLISSSAASILQHRQLNAEDQTIIQLEECLCDFCKEIKSCTALQTRKTLTKQHKQKEWTFIVYMASDNDLRSFAARNIKQMASIGSNKYINVVVHLDIRISGNKKITRRYFIEKNRILHVNPHDPSTQSMDSGNPKTLVNCCEWAIKNYPANDYALIFWNHGTGIIDPPHGRIINPAGLFTFNPATNRLELDRSIGFLDLINCMEPEQRGICWDDTTGNYLTNQKLDQALSNICKSHLNGKKFSIIGFDACLMSMIEIGNIIKKYAHIMVSSQEVELGMGWNYSFVLYPFAEKNLNKNTFAQHIVNMYGKTYGSITNDYTLSAMNLNAFSALEENVDQVARLCIEGMNKQSRKSVKNAIRASRNKRLCTHFDEPSYVDLYHLYCNLLVNLKHFKFTNPEEDMAITHKLSQVLTKGKKLIEYIVFANTAGRNLKYAHGISIYFPEHNIHSSYKATNFVVNNAWGIFLTQYLMG